MRNIKSLLVCATILGSVAGMGFGMGGPDDGKMDHKGKWANVEGSMENWTVTQADVLPIIAAIDVNEIAAGALATTKDGGELVSGFGKMMVEDHEMNLRDSLKLCEKIDGTHKTAASVMDTAELASYKVEGGNKGVKWLGMKGREELGRLAMLQGDEFKKAYLDAMVKGHQDALNLIDTKLLPAASSNEDLRKFLTDTREAVAKHLKRAQELRG